MNISRIILIDDHPLLRKGVDQLIALEDNLEVVAEASSGEEGITLAIEHQPDLILLDLNMKSSDGKSFAYFATLLEEPYKNEFLKMLINHGIDIEEAGKGARAIG